jgi:hypothetical protein
MDIFYRLLFGHLLADFTLQTNFIADWKRRKFLGLLVHVILHPICYVALTFPYINETWATWGGVALSGWLCVAIATIAHFLEDWFRVTMVQRGWPDNTLFYAWDQAIHLVVLWFLSPVATQPLPHPWPILGCLFVMVTHCATVTVWFIEKDIYGRDYPATEEKYISMLQRLVVWLAFFLPAPWWYLVLVTILVLYGRHVWTRRLEFSWSSVLMGNILAIGCGLIARYGLNVHY